MYEVHWTPQAEITFNENIEYLMHSWDLPTLSIFLNRVDDVIENIKKNPKLYPTYSTNERVRKCILNKHIILFYTIHSDSKIDIITFWNTHRDPDNLKL